LPGERAQARFVPARGLAFPFARYEKENVALRVGRLDGRLALAAYVAGGDRAAYFILLELEAGRVTAIRDFRYVPYIAAEADFEISAA